MLDENSVVGDLVALFSEDEIACLVGQVGADALAAVQSTPIVMFDQVDLIAGCISPEKFAMISEAMIGIMGGPEFSPESQACLEGFYAEFGMTPPPDGSDTAAEFAYLFNYLMCLTDEEAMALSAGGEDAPLPSQLRCLTAQVDPDTLFLLLGSVEEIFAGSASPEVLAALQEVQIASMTCGLDLLSLAG